jgi:hypothetical protein
MLCRQTAGPTIPITPVIEQNKITAALGHDDTPAAKIARKLGVSADTIREIFAVDARGGLEVVVGVGKLDQATAGATKELAILVGGPARQPFWRTHLRIVFSATRRTGRSANFDILRPYFWDLTLAWCRCIIMT